MRWPASSAIGAIALAAQSVATLRADAAAARAQRMNVTRDWPHTELDLAEALKHSGRDTVYRNKAAVRYAERFSVSGERAISEQGARLLDAAHRLDPFNPYIAIHRIALETSAIQKRTVREVLEAVRDVRPVVLSLDRTNGAPADAMAYTLLGLTYQAMNELSVARPAFATALQLTPDGSAAR